MDYIQIDSILISLMPFLFITGMGILFIAKQHAASSIIYEPTIFRNPSALGNGT